MYILVDVNFAGGGRGIMIGQILADVLVNGPYGRFGQSAAMTALSPILNGLNWITFKG